MSMIDVRQVVEAPTRVPYRFGLFSVLDFQPSSRGTLALAWDSIGCSPTQAAQDPCLTDGGEDHTKTPNVDCETGSPVSFSVIAYDDSSLGRDRAESSDRARQKLLIGEQYTAEMMFSAAFDGNTTDVTGLVPLPTTLNTAAELWTAAIGEIEQALGEQGGEGLIFMPRAAASAVSDYLNITGSVARTKLGTPIAFLAGWDYATSDAVIGVSATVAVRGEIATGNAWNMLINDHSEYAERDYALGWECDALVVNPSSINV